MTAAQIDSALWYLGRGAGVVALVAFTVTLVLGILTRSGRPLFTLPRFAVAEVHKTTSLLATTLLATHIVTLTLDAKAQLRWVDAVLPFTGAWRAGWVGLGTLALDLVIAVVATSLLRPRIGRRVWRAVHWAAYAMWPLAFAHSLGTGTDAGSRWFLTLALGCLAAVLAAMAWRASAAVFGLGSYEGGFFDRAGRVPGTRRPLPPVRPDASPPFTSTPTSPR